VRILIPVGKKHLRLQQRDILIILCILVVVLGAGTVELIHPRSHPAVATADDAAIDQSYPVSVTDEQSQNKYAPKLMQIGQTYYDDNHLISYELKSVDTGYIDPKLQNEEYCPEYQQMQAQGSHIVQNVSCTITSKLLTWEFTNATGKAVDVPGVYVLYTCMASSAAADNSPSTSAGYQIMSEGYDPGPGTNGDMYWVTHTSHPDDPAKVLSASDILTGTLKDTIYQPHETKIVESELGHNCTAVGESVLGGSYEGWQI
jgi:hypothetical protein